MGTKILKKNSRAEQLTAIDKRSNISFKELFKEYIEPEIPVIIKDAVKNWGSMGKFTPDFFAQHYGDLTESIKGKDYKMVDFVELMKGSTNENPAPYPFKINIENRLPELMADIRPDVLYGKMDRINHALLPKFMLNGTDVYEFFFGGKGASFPFLHYDALFMHTQITQIYGAKEFIFYAPNQTEFLYPSEENPKFSPIDVLNPDYNKFPLFKQAREIRCTVEEGETLFFPTGWWHTTQIHEPCITMGRAQLNSSNWKDFVDDNYRLWKRLHPNYTKLGIPVKMYATLLGKFMSLQEKFL